VEKVMTTWASEENINGHDKHPIVGLRSKEGSLDQSSQGSDAGPNARDDSIEPEPCILVVDDDVLIRQQIERLYAHNGYTVLSAETAEQALNYLETEDVDLVVSDIQLPGLSGVELTERTQRLHPDIPVIVITGHADIDNAVEVLKLGATDYIVKPFGADVIQEATQRVLEKNELLCRDAPYPAPAQGPA
jgi:DNA-binding NtrC family response regulator